MLNYSGYYDRYLEKLTLQASNDNRLDRHDAKDIVDYATDMQARGITARRLMTCVPILRMHALSLRMMKTTFRKAKEEELKRIVINVDKDKTIADWTKYNRKVVLKRFYKWLLGDDEEYPKIVKWIKIKSPKNSVLPEYLLTEDEVLRMIDCADTIRDKAFLYALYESGARMGEMLSLQIKDVTFGEHLTSILVKGKTGQRRIPLVVCTAYISDWINMHPFRQNPEAFLWCALYSGNRRPDKQLCYFSVVKMLRNAAKKAGVNKRVNPHTFRHSRATHLAKKLTEAQLKQFFGWVQSSSMASQYVHLSGRDLDNAVLGLYGITTEEEKSAVKISQEKCPRCEMPNPSNFMLCRRCGSALNDESAMQIIENKHEQSLSVMSEVIRQFKELENKGFDLQQFSKFVESWVKSKGGEQ